MNQRVLKFKGTHREIGEQVGLLYKKWGHTYSYLPPFADRYHPQQLKTYEKFYPQYLNFLTGLAKGLGIDKDKMIKISLTIFLAPVYAIVERRCSTFAVHNNQGVLVGRNYDWLEASEQHSKFLQYDYTDRTSFSIKGISDMGTWKSGKLVGPEEFVLMTEDAWNENFYIGLNGAPGKKKNIGISTPHVVQLIAEQCQKVDEALSILEKIPIPNSQIYTLADKKGNLAVVEKSLERGIKVRKSTKFIIATNHFNHKDLVSLNAMMFEKVPFHSSFSRYHYLESHLINKWNDLDFRSINSLMNKPPVVQNWRGIKNGDVMTIWQLALNLKKGESDIVFAPLTNQKQVITN